MTGVLPLVPMNEHDDRSLLQVHLEEGNRLRRRLPGACDAHVLAAAVVVRETLQQGGKLLICGNGGSAAASQHLAAEFVGALDPAVVRRGLPAVALTADTSILTAVGNDFGLEAVFERQVEALGRAGDTLLAISASGQSENVVRAARRARAARMTVVGLTGAGGGDLAACCDLCIRVPSDQTQQVQEAHLAIGHVLCALVERTV